MAEADAADDINEMDESNNEAYDILPAVTSIDGWVQNVTTTDGLSGKNHPLSFEIGFNNLPASGWQYLFFRVTVEGTGGWGDVLQLEAVLDGAGYDVGDVDGLYTEETRSGLSTWQADHGYGGTTAEVNEVVTVSLQGNPAGYTVGPVNAVSVRIGPAVRSTVGLQGGQVAEVIAEAALVVDAVSAAEAPVPTVSLSTGAVVVEEGSPVVVTVTADVAPTADLEIPITVSGDVTVDDDYVGLDDTIVLPAGRLSVTVEVVTLLDDDREPYEDMKVAISGGFESLASVASQTLAVYDARKEIDDLLMRVDDLVDDIEEKADSREANSRAANSREWFCGLAVDLVRSWIVSHIARDGLEAVG